MLSATKAASAQLPQQPLEPRLALVAQWHVQEKSSRSLLRLLGSVVPSSSCAEQARHLDLHRQAYPGAACI